MILGLMTAKILPSHEKVLKAANVNPDVHSDIPGSPRFKFTRFGFEFFLSLAGEFQSYEGLRCAIPLIFGTGNFNPSAVIIGLSKSLYGDIQQHFVSEHISFCGVLSNGGVVYVVNPQNQSLFLLYQNQYSTSWLADYDAMMLIQKASDYQIDVIKPVSHISWVDWPSWHVQSGRF